LPIKTELFWTETECYSDKRYKSPALRMTIMGNFRVFWRKSLGDARGNPPHEINGKNVVRFPRESCRKIALSLRVREKITSQNWRLNLDRVWPIRESKTTRIASYFEEFTSEVSFKDVLKVRWKNVKLFFREPEGASRRTPKKRVLLLEHWFF
jgi:hypothetical protein